MNVLTPGVKNVTKYKFGSDVGNLYMINIVKTRIQKCHGVYIFIAVYC